MTNYY